jgi:hypothetical protein
MQKSVYFSSANRDNGGSIEDFTITDSSGKFAIPPTTVKLTYASIPYTWYNILSSNNAFTLIEPNNGGFTAPLTITPGNYDGDQLASAVQTALNAAGGVNTYTVNYSSATLKFTISATGNFQLQFTSPDNIATRLGFVSGTTTSSATSVTSPNIAQILSDTEIFICSDLVGGIDNGYSLLQPGVSTNTQILAVVNIVGTFGDVIAFQDRRGDPPFTIKQSNYSQLFSSSDRVVRFFLQFPSQFPLDLNGVNWSATLTFGFD